LPLYLESNDAVSNLEYFRCLATVGADYSTSAKLEQGLSAARFALDPNGPNAEQALDFIREGAQLVLVFMSDEEDCSVKPECFDKEKESWKVRDCIPAEEYDGCAQNENLESVNAFVDFFKSLKDDPSRVFVAAIVGDSQEVDEDARSADIEVYRQSEENNIKPGMHPYICKSDDGVADYGGRYVELVNGFGSKGMVANICGPALCDLGDGAQGYVDDDGACQAIPEGMRPGGLGIYRALEMLSEKLLGCLGPEGCEE